MFERLAAFGLKRQPFSSLQVPPPKALRTNWDQETPSPPPPHTDPSWLQARHSKPLVQGALALSRIHLDSPWQAMVPQLPSGASFFFFTFPLPDLANLFLSFGHLRSFRFPILTSKQFFQGSRFGGVSLWFAPSINQPKKRV